jgi:predicted RNA-binding protein YlxR (DUF448 family)
MRTCVGCRVVRPQVELLRTRCPGGRVAATKAGAPGRSAYVCPTRACVEQAARKGGFKRSFRSNTVVETESLWAALAVDVTALERRNQKRSEEMHASGRNA